MTKYSFLCPNGTIFNQEYFICDWWFNVDCSKAEDLAESRNAELEAAQLQAESQLSANNNNQFSSRQLELELESNVNSLDNNQLHAGHDHRRPQPKPAGQNSQTPDLDTDRQVQN